MPISKQTEELINTLLSSRPKHVSEMPLTEVRELSLKSAKMLGPKFEPVNSVLDQEISGPYGNIPFRIFSPNSSGVQPAIIYFFSGGFLWGSIEGQDTICRSLANASNCKVISVGYRLAPEYKFPVAANEAYFVTKWIYENAPSLGIDPKRIAISGYSSGGNLAALTAIKARNEQLPLAYQILICPWLDLSCSLPSHHKFAEGYIADSKMMKMFIDNYIPNLDAKNPIISPYWEQDLSNLAPTLMITAEYDPLADEGKSYSERLHAAKVKTSYSCYSGQIHGFLAYLGFLDQEKNPLIEIGTILKKALF